MSVAAWPIVHRRAWRSLLRVKLALLDRRKYRRVVLEDVCGMTFVILPDVFNPKLLRSGEFLVQQLARPDLLLMRPGWGGGLPAYTAISLESLGEQDSRDLAAHLLGETDADAARVVEPFTGEGIYYALRSGELAAQAIAKIIRGQDRRVAVGEFSRAHAAMYRGRLWINQLARAAVLSPRFASQLMRVTPFGALIARSMTNRIAGRGD